MKYIAKRTRPTAMTAHIFVYGTLMSGFGNAYSRQLAAQGQLLGPGTIPGLLYRVEWYPGAVYLPGEDSRVHGEVVRLFSPPEMLPFLDEYEELNPDESKSLYIRRPVPVRLDSGGTLTCWTYLYNRPVQDLELIRSGDFRTCRHITS